MTEISDWSDLEAQLQETKQLLAEIEQRFHQVQHDLIEQQELQNKQEQLKLQIPDGLNNQKLRRKPNSGNERSPANPQKEALRQQLLELSDRLEQIEGDLESRLLSWSSFREPFWQIVRFGGIGVIIGVILKSCAP